MGRQFHWCFSLTSIRKHFFRQGVLFSLGLHFESVFQIVLGLQNINLVMHFKLDFIETTQWGLESSIIFKTC